MPILDKTCKKVLEESADLGWSWVVATDNTGFYSYWIYDPKGIKWGLSGLWINGLISYEYSGGEKGLRRDMANHLLECRRLFAKKPENMEDVSTEILGGK